MHRCISLSTIMNTPVGMQFVIYVFNIYISSLNEYKLLIPLDDYTACFDEACYYIMKQQDIKVVKKKYKGLVVIYEALISCNTT